MIASPTSFSQIGGIFNVIPDERTENDTISVRDDETFDTKSLARYLIDKLPGTKSSLTVRQFWGGAANLTYLLDFEGKEYVLRRPPLGPVAKSAHDMNREYTVLSVLHKAFPYAPKAYMFCEDLSIIGAPFFIMERKKGFVIRRSFPKGLTPSPKLATEISNQLVDRLVEFHNVDYERLGLSELGRPEGFIKRQVEGWYRRWHRAKTEDNEDVDQVYNWLRKNIPKTEHFSLVHNDFKLDNVMVDSSGQIVAIFDWDMCTLGDPLSDLGALLTYWTDPTDPPYLQVLSTMPTHESIGWPSRQELIERYEAKSGIAVSNVQFYHTLGLFRLTVIIAQIYIRFVNKQTQDQRFGALGTIIPFVARAANETALGNFPGE